MIYRMNDGINNGTCSMGTTVVIIACIGENNEIGLNGVMPWRHFHNDMVRFRNMTIGKPVIMGYNTAVSIGMPLDGRLNMVISNNAAPIPGFPTKCTDRIQYFESVSGALRMLDDVYTGIVFVAGGAGVYEQAMPYADYIFLTEILHDFKADTFFPEFDMTEWENYRNSEIHEGVWEYPYVFASYRRRENFRRLPSIK